MNDPFYYQRRELAESERLGAAEDRAKMDIFFWIAVFIGFWTGVYLILHS